MQEEEPVLLNFRIPATLKSTFDHMCKYRNVSMTSQLNILIREHINKEFFALKQEEWMEQARKNEPIEFLSSYQEIYEDY
jgi:antitoxin component of RelBE/YafQ-DinJ toxin-antitoxin module